MRRLDIANKKVKSINFYWNDKAYTAEQGDTLASALMANGIRVLGRSFKLGRRRGLMSYGVEEANIMATIEPNSIYQTPNVKATEILVYENLKAIPATSNPSIAFDWRAFLSPFHRFMPVGFYYKIFKWPRKLAPFYSNILRNLAGFSKYNPYLVDKESYTSQHHYCDVLIVGAGIAGLQSALSISQNDNKSKIILVEQTTLLGGETLADKNIDVKASQTLDKLITQVKKLSNISIFKQTTVFGLYEGNLAQAVQKITFNLAISEKELEKVAQKLHHIRFKNIILATGSHERPLLYKNNDLPSTMLASSARRYFNQHNVLFSNHPVVVGNNNSIYLFVKDLTKRGVKPIVVDMRCEESVEKESINLCINSGLEHHIGYVPTEAKSGGVGNFYGVKQLKISPIIQNDNTIKIDDNKAKSIVINCDGVAMSGGFSPVIHLSAQNGNKPQFNSINQSFMPPTTHSNNQFYCGSVNAASTWQDCVSDAQNLTSIILQSKDDKLSRTSPKPLTTLATFVNLQYNNTFVDFQNDVKVSDIKLAIQENYKSIEHIKRYTAIGFGTDQGKTSNVNAIAVVGEILNKELSEVSTTTFRPPYTGVSFGVMSSGHKNYYFEPERRTSMHAEHEKLNAVWEQVGQWYRARYYPKQNESMLQVLKRECLAARETVAMMDVSTLGKIDIHGKDAREFLSRVYTNNWHTLKPGQCKYGLMCDEKGMIIDDGVSSCISDNHFYMTTTTGGAAKVYEHLETWLQTEWSDLEIYLTSVTEQWAAVAVVGPQARDLMQQVESDIDFSNEQFPFMHWRYGKWGSFQARIMRISFSGEQSYEINVPVTQGQELWNSIKTVGEKYNITPYGTESMHVLRAEKGFIIVGQDTDGSNTPSDMAMSWVIRSNPNESFIGERSLTRSDLLRENRKQFVGLLNHSNPQQVFPEGSAVLGKDKELIGHITSSYFSPILGYSIALAMIENGHKSFNQIVTIRLLDATYHEAKITSSIFYDAKGEKMKS